MPEADGPAEATKTNLGSYPLIKKILSADKKKEKKKKKKKKKKTKNPA